MSFVRTLSRFISATSNFSSSKSYQPRRVRRAGREYMDKNLVPHHPLNNIEITNYFNYKFNINFN